MKQMIRIFVAIFLVSGLPSFAFGRDVAFSIDFKNQSPLLGILRGEAKFTINKSQEGVIGAPDFMSVGSAELRFGRSWILLPQCLAKYIQSSNEGDVDIGFLSNLILKEPKASTLRLVFRPGADVEVGNDITTELHFDTDPLLFKAIKIRRPAEGEAVQVPLSSVCADVELGLMLPRQL